VSKDEIAARREAGLAFEEELARELGLQRVPGSGSGFSSRLDLHGYGVRWSLKWTRKDSCPVGANEIDEAVCACEGPGGTGDIPVWAVRLRSDPKYDLVIMRKNDWKAMCEDASRLHKQSSADAKRIRSSIPAIIREANESQELI